MSSADQSSQSVREAAIRKKISRIAKQYNVSLESVTAEQLVAEAQKGRTKLEERRRTRHPLAKWGNTLQRFANAWSQFMKVYAGVNEVAKGIDNQYGALTSGALMVLLQVRLDRVSTRCAQPRPLIPYRLERIKNPARRQLYPSLRSSRSHGSATLDA